MWRIYGKRTAPCPKIYYLWRAQWQKNVAAFFWFIPEYTVYKKERRQDVPDVDEDEVEADVQPDEGFKEQWLSSLV